MKKLFFIILSLFIMPFFCYADYSYVRNPSGREIPSPVNISFSFDNVSEINFSESVNFWNLDIEGGSGWGEEYPYNAAWSECYPISEKTISYSVNLPVGADMNSFAIQGYYTDDECTYGGEDELSEPITGYEWNGMNDHFIIIASKIITIGTASSTDTMAALGTLFTDLWTLIALAIGIPLAFYVIRQILRLMPVRVSKE